MRLELFVFLSVLNLFVQGYSLEKLKHKVVLVSVLEHLE